VDTPGYFPRAVRASAEFLKDAVDKYLFISTISVYDPEPGAKTITEDTRKATLADETVEEVTGETYGGLKALCERALSEVLAARVVIVRPGYIVGSHDPTDRFTYWATRVARGGRMLAGGSKDAPLQVIDARDIGRFNVDLLEQGATGTYNVCGPERPLSWEEFLDRAKAALGASTELVWTDQAKLEEIGAEAGKDLPLYSGSDQTEYPFMRTDNSRAVARGLTFTPLEDTVRDTVQWANSRGDVELKVGMSEQREKELLAKL
jgi:2'-hydroxyisoflavone reductase